MEKRLKIWCHKWLSRAGRLVLVKSVLEAIPVYWISLAWIPVGILEKARRLCFRFLWSGKKESRVVPWVNWKRIAVPKGLGGRGLKNIYLFAQALAAKGGWRLIKTNSLWTQVIAHKYLAPLTIEEWIRLRRKSHAGGSVIWKAVVKSFPLLESNLAWRVGNGQKLRIGRDPWAGCDQQHVLPDHITEQLGQLGVFTLCHLADPFQVMAGFQQWRWASSFGFEGQDEQILDKYIRALERAHIHLNIHDDMLIWDVDPCGFYSPKIGYIKLSFDNGIREEVWWWRKIWKLKCPPKAKLFMWCVLERKVPTWDFLQKRNFQGPGWCVLCKMDIETCSHLFLNFPFIVRVWTECSKLLGVQCRWAGRDICMAWEAWWGHMNQPKLKILPLLVIWGVWLARNSLIFQDKSCTLEVTCVTALGIYEAFPIHIRAARQRVDMDIIIDKSHPWGFFDGAAQHHICGGGAVLFLSDTHYFELSYGFGEGNNNFAEMLSLKILLTFAVEKGIVKISVMGNSMNVVNWINEVQQCRNIRLENILVSINAVIHRFDTFDCRHIYRANNEKADRASKKGLQMDMGIWHVVEHRDGGIYEYYHRPFIEQLQQ